MATVFTKEQESAIRTTDKTLLVSAAAGSGKTATLTERIIRSITDVSSPESIENMLIVTFTRAAAAELGDRIGNAIKAKISEQPQNEHLKRQLYMLPGARISTIDAFCADIFRSCAEKFGVSPSYRVLEPIEASILAHSVWSNLIDAIYSENLPDVASPDELAELSVSLSGAKSESMLEDTLDMLYDKTTHLCDGVKFFFDVADKYEKAATLPLADTDIGEFLRELYCEIYTHYEAVYSSLIPLIPKEKENERAITFFSEELLYISEAKGARTYERIMSNVTRKFPARPSAAPGTNPALDRLIEAREAFKGELSEFKKSFFFTTEQGYQEQFLKISRLVRVLARITEKFSELFFEEKRKRGALEYSDVERLAYESLVKNGEPTEYALSVKEQFSSVYIDEYQDVNDLQDAIFAAISRDDNRFMVGDIKQSIYGFRGAKPEAFARMKAEFPPLDSERSSPAASVFMSNNFRCNKPIIDFTNDIFDKVFTLLRESIGYVSEDKLVFSKKDVPEKPADVKVALICPDKPDLQGEDVGADDGLDADVDCAAYVAAEIARLVSAENKDCGEPISPSDIAILLRGDRTGDNARSYRDALKKYGIEVNIPEEASLFSVPEVQLALCLLYSIDNPCRDIYLAGLLCSPLYAFTADELYLIRKFGNKRTLYESLVSYTESRPDFAKGKAFLDTLNHYRALAEGMTTDALILRLYDETGLMALAESTKCKENLLLLYNYAREFEGKSYSGLYSFVDYINGIINSGKKFSGSSTKGSENAVTVTTIHKSKGLEFPVVFIAESHARLLPRKSTQRIVFSEELGIGLRPVAKGGIALVNNGIMNAIDAKCRRDSLEEEMRVYYVALTRARERLYLVGKTHKDFDTFISQAKALSEYKTRHTVSLYSSFLSLAVGMSEECEVVRVQGSGVGTSQPDARSREDTVLEKDCRLGKQLYELLLKRFSYVYPRQHLTELPEKLSVSTLYPTVLDGADESAALTLDALPSRKEGHVLLPEFISGESYDESAKRGIATHTFMQFCDFSALISYGTGKELSRLVREGFLSKESAKLVRQDEIEAFRSSNLIKEIISAKKLYRELRFNLNLPAKLFTENAERAAALVDKELLLQGVIDCIIEDENGDITLVDYKTDRLPPDAIKDKRTAQKILAQRHALQLSYYSLAIEKMFGRAPKRRLIYSLALGDTVDVCNEN